jgi:polyamine oxidase
MYDPQ